MGAMVLAGWWLVWRRRAPSSAPAPATALAPPFAPPAPPPRNRRKQVGWILFEMPSKRFPRVLLRLPAYVSDEAMAMSHIEPTDFASPWNELNNDFYRHPAEMFKKGHGAKGSLDVSWGRWRQRWEPLTTTSPTRSDRRRSRPWPVRWAKRRRE